MSNTKLWQEKYFMLLEESAKRYKTIASKRYSHFIGDMLKL